MVVLGVAHADGVVCGEPKVVERLEDAAAFSYPRRQYHQFAAVADHLAVQAQLADHLEHGRFISSSTGDQHLPRRGD